MGGRTPNRGFEVAADGLAQGVASMSMEAKPLNSGGLAQGLGKERVSGLDSFMDSSSESGNSNAKTGEYISMQDRLRMARGAAGRRTGDLFEDAMDVDKQKRSMEAVNAERKAAMNEMGDHSKVMAGVAVSDSLSAEHGALPAKRCKMSNSKQAHLTGAQEEPRQEQ